jgi:hypothetical protein
MGYMLRLTRTPSTPRTGSTPLKLPCNICNILLLDIAFLLVYSNINEGIFKCLRDCQASKGESCNNYQMGEKRHF